MTKVTSQKRWKFVPVTHDALLEIKEFVNKDTKFLDVGCGYGNVLEYIKPHVNVADGLEYNKHYIKGFKKLNPELDSKVFNQDALKFKEYGNYSFIYFYGIYDCPDMLRKLCKVVSKQVKTGTILVPISVNIRQEVGDYLGFNEEGEEITEIGGESWQILRLSPLTILKKL